ncbi:MAG: hypothetical protein JSU64_03590, partial [candidate division WOR-3 bacterium]
AVTITNSEISGEDEDEINSMVNESEFFSIPEPSADTNPDEEQYFISIEMGGQTRNIYMARSKVPNELKPLISFLKKRAKYEKRSK